MKIIIINGYPRSGKDTFIDICMPYASLEACSIIDAVKIVAEEAGWNGGKEPKDRKFLCDLKDLLTDYNDFPLKCVFDFTADTKTSYPAPDLLFITMRQPSDIWRFKRKYPEAITIFIERDEAKAAYQESEVLNAADSGVEDWNYDYYISNNGSIEDLDEAAKTFLKELEVI